MGGLNSRCSKQNGGQWLPARMMPSKCDWFFGGGGGVCVLNSASTNIPHKVGTVRDYACLSSKGRRAGSWQRGEELPCQSWLCSVGQGNSPGCSTRRPCCQPSHSQAIHACDRPFRKCVLTFMQTPQIPPKALQGLGSLKPIHGCQVKNPYTRPCV